MKQLVVGVKRLDATEPPSSQKSYKEIVKEVNTYVKNIGHDSDAVEFVPISGWKGDSMLEPSANMQWFKRWKATCKNVSASGTTLLETLDCVLPPTHPNIPPGCLQG